MESARPLDTAQQFAYRSLAIQRSKWMHHFHVWSPKLARRLSLYSREAVDFWVMIESHAGIQTFCEYPGFILVDQKPRIADFVLRKGGTNEFVVLDAAPLVAIDADACEILDPLPVTTVSVQALQPHRQWIDNWLRMLPYVTSNVQFLSRELLERIEQDLISPKPLYTIERDALPTDPILTRSAVFDLTRRGRLASLDLRTDVLSMHTRFVQAIATEGTP